MSGDPKCSEMDRGGYPCGVGTKSTRFADGKCAWHTSDIARLETLHAQRARQGGSRRVSQRLAQTATRSLNTKRIRQWKWEQRRNEVIRATSRGPV